MNECRDCVEQPLMADGTPLSLFVCVCVSLGCTARLSRRNLNAQREYSTASSLRNRNLAILLISRGRLWRAVTGSRNTFRR